MAGVIPSVGSLPSGTRALATAYMMTTGHTNSLDKKHARKAFAYGTWPEATQGCALAGMQAAARRLLC